MCAFILTIIYNDCNLPAELTMLSCEKYRTLFKNSRKKVRVIENKSQNRSLSDK